MRCREAGQSRMLPFLGAAALFAALTITAHSLVLGLAAIIAGPVPAAQTALSLSRKAVASGRRRRRLPPRPPRKALYLPLHSLKPPLRREASRATLWSFWARTPGLRMRALSSKKNYPQGSGGKYVPLRRGQHQK